MVWGQPPTSASPDKTANVPKLSLREVMEQEESNRKQQSEDAADAALQAALSLSQLESTPTAKTCSICTFMNKFDAQNCEMCTSLLFEKTPQEEITEDGSSPLRQAEGVSDAEDLTSDTDFAIALTMSNEKLSVPPETNQIDETSVHDASADLAYALSLQEEEEQQRNSAPWSQEKDLSKQRDPMWQARHANVDNLGLIFGFEKNRKIIGADDVEEEVDNDDEEEETRNFPDKNEDSEELIDPRKLGVSWVKLSNGKIITKHDKHFNNQKNITNAMNHLPNMGDIDSSSSTSFSNQSINHLPPKLHKSQINLSNTTYNSMARSVRKANNGHMKKGVNQRGRIEASMRATRVGVLDMNTRKTVLSLINKGILEEMNGVVKTGKEASVFHAIGKEILENDVSDDDLTDDEEEEEEREIDQEEDEGIEEVDEDMSSEKVENDFLFDFEKLNESNLSKCIDEDKDEEASASSSCSSKSSNNRMAFSPHKKHHHPTSNNPNVHSQSSCQHPTTTTATTMTAMSTIPVAVKVFFTSLDQFSNRIDYIKDDPRYAGKNINRLTKRKLLFTWCEKEFRNLCRVHRIGIPSPKPIFHKKQILIMKFIYDEEYDSSSSISSTTPAPQLQELSMNSLSSSQWHRCYLQTIAIMRSMYLKAKLVHADLSEYNILYKNKNVYMIDFGQALDIHHPSAIHFLTRDLKNILSFYHFKRSVATHSLKTLLTFITDIEYVFPSQSCSSIRELNEDGIEKAFGCYAGDEEYVSDALDSLAASNEAVMSAVHDALNSSSTTCQLFADSPIPAN